MGLTPLCPAGHLPLKGGRSTRGEVPPISTFEIEVTKERLADLPP